MTQEERLNYLIHCLESERRQRGEGDIAIFENEPKRHLRALMNIRMPQKASEEFLRIQDEYLRHELDEKGIIDYRTLTPEEPGIYLWQGDITTLGCDAIVNAANSQMLGCFCPNHGCIDNAIHTYAGVQLREECAKIMRAQGHEEEKGKAKITSGFNLPCKYVLHTVGPIIHGRVTKKDKQMLASCYRACLEMGEKNGAKSIAFCCISTGEFHFPNELAAKTAVSTVREYLRETKSNIEVIFNVFKEIDRKIYKGILG